MADAGGNAFDALSRWLLSWKETFDGLRARLGTVRAVLLVGVVGAGAVWWNWDDIHGKRGVDGLIRWVALKYEALRPSNRLGRFTVEWQNFDRAAAASGNSRFWTWGANRWEEKTPTGDVMFHDFQERMSLDGCKGDLTRKEMDSQLLFFVPFKDCPNMTLRFNYRQGGWQPFGAMVDMH